MIETDLLMLGVANPKLDLSIGAGLEVCLKSLGISYGAGLMTAERFSFSKDLKRGCPLYKLMSVFNKFSMVSEPNPWFSKGVLVLLAGWIGARGATFSFIFFS